MKKKIKNSILELVEGDITDIKADAIVNELAEYFGLYPSSISQLETEEGKVSDVLAKRRLSRDIQIYRMYKLGWKQDEIGRIFNSQQSGISKRIFQISKNEIRNIQHQYFENKKLVEEIAQFHNMDLITTWSIILDGKSDEERFELFSKSEDFSKFCRC